LKKPETEQKKSCLSNQFGNEEKEFPNGRAASPAPVLQAAGSGLQNNALERLAA